MIDNKITEALDELLSVPYYQDAKDAKAEALKTLKAILADPQEVRCPFCQEEGFDLPGLKSHLMQGCEEYNNMEFWPYLFPKY